MPEHYGEKVTKDQNKKTRAATNGMTDKQKKDLQNHMMKLRKDDGMSPSEIKSHRMKMMARMKKGMSVGAAHKDIMKEQ